MRERRGEWCVGYDNSQTNAAGAVANFMSLVKLLNLTFEREVAADGTRTSDSLH
jgi:hypothetical protein